MALPSDSIGLVHVDCQINFSLSHVLYIREGRAIDLTCFVVAQLCRLVDSNGIIAYTA